MRATIASAQSFILLIALTLLPALSAQAEGEEEEKKPWSGSVDLGAGHSTGTKDSYNGRLQTALQRDWERDRLRLNLDAIYGKSDGDIDKNAQKVFGDYRHNFTKRFYGVWNAEVGRDTVENVKVRALTTLGPGCRIWERDEKSHLDGELGAGFRHESFLLDSETNEKTPARNNFELRAAYEYNDVVGPSQALELSHGTEVLLPPSDIDTFLVRSRIGLAVPLVLELKFSFSFDVEYQNEPAQGAEKWNTKGTLGLLYQFQF